MLYKGLDDYLEQGVTISLFILIQAYSFVYQRFARPQKRPNFSEVHYEAPAKRQALGHTVYTQVGGGCLYGAPSLDAWAPISEE